jgi:hypothetical protein
MTGCIGEKNTPTGFELTTQIPSIKYFSRFHTIISPFSPAAASKQYLYETAAHTKSS